jgi:hypothetical protein
MARLAGLAGLDALSSMPVASAMWLMSWLEGATPAMQQRAGMAWSGDGAAGSAGAQMQLMHITASASMQQQPGSTTRHQQHAIHAAKHSLTLAITAQQRQQRHGPTAAAEGLTWQAVELAWLAACGRQCVQQVLQV